MADIDDLERNVMQAASAGRIEDASAALQTLLKMQPDQRQAATSLLRIVRDGHLPIERSLEVLTEIEACHPSDIELVSLLGDCLERACDIDFLNAPPPDQALFETVVNTLSRAASDPNHSGHETRILEGLATAARMRARQSDAVAEAAHKRLVELEPELRAATLQLRLILEDLRKVRGGDERQPARRRAVEGTGRPV